MDKQPEALRLADASDNSGFYRAPQEVERAMATELRRQHALIAELVEALRLIASQPGYEPDEPYAEVVSAVLSKAKEQ